MPYNHKGGVILIVSDSLELARYIVDLIADKKGEDVVVLDIREISILADYFVIASATSQRQSQAILEDIREKTRESFGRKPLHIEGEADAGWILIDYGEVVVHLFTPEVRAYYDLEGLWRSARVALRII